ncbi:MAG: STAS domain-containing protein [Baekduiaceae bacterium]
MDAASEPSGRARRAPAPFELTVDLAGAWTVVRPVGEIDLATAGRVEQAAAGADGDVVIDLRAVTFLDSSALRLLIQEERRAREGGHAFAVVPGGPEVQRLLQIAGLDARLRVLEDPDVIAPD